MFDWLRCLVRGHQPIPRREGRLWGWHYECLRCGRTLGATTLVPSWRLLRALHQDRRSLRSASQGSAPCSSGSPRAARRPGTADTPSSGRPA